MSVIIDKTSSVFFSTTFTDQNVRVSENGSKITVNLDNPIGFPSSALYATLEISQAAVWWTSPNIGDLYNNNKFVYLINSVVQPEIVIPNGLYSLTSLNSYLSREFVNRGQDGNLISFIGDDSTSKVVLTIGVDNVQADFDSVGSVGAIMGFSGIVPTTLEPSGTSVESQNQATFNSINSYAIKSDILSGGIPVNNSGLNILANIPITAKIGSQINYAPTNPIRVDASELRGKRKQAFYLQLVDQDGNNVSTAGEPWSCLIVLRYGVLLSNTSVPLLDV